MTDIATATLAAQSYGIACAQATFGGPRGIWLECKTCSTSQVIVGSKSIDDPLANITDAEAASIFRRHGWTGNGDKMTDQRCPNCTPDKEKGAGQ